MRGIVLSSIAIGACYAPTARPGSPCGNGDPCPADLVCSAATHTCERAGVDEPVIDGAVGQPGDGAADASDLGPRLIFVTSTKHTGSLGGLSGADAICQARAQAASLPGVYKAWLADANQSPATRMNHHLGPYQLVTAAVIAQGWNDLADGNLAARIDRTETGVQLGGVGCNPSQSTCNFICEGGEVWSNVDGAGNRRSGVGDCGGWTGSGNGAAGNVGKVDVLWTAGICAPITCSAPLPIFCIQQ